MYPTEYEMKDILYLLFMILQSKVNFDFILYCVTMCDKLFLLYIKEQLPFSLQNEYGLRMPNFSTHI